MARIAYIKKAIFTEHRVVGHGSYNGSSFSSPRTIYTAYWSLYLVLSDTEDLLPLFQWQKRLGTELSLRGSIPHCDYETKLRHSRQNRDFELVVKRLRELTGKEATWG